MCSTHNLANVEEELQDEVKSISELVKFFS